MTVVFFIACLTLLGAATSRAQEAGDAVNEGSRITLAPPGEPGVPLVVAGTLRTAGGAPFAGARLRVFQADASGRYTPQRPMDEPNARLAGRLVSDSEGRFEVRTVRPGGYTEPVTLRGAERYIPAHIHFEITATGFVERRFQLVFDDDPRMDDDYWREWAAKGRHPVAHVTGDDTGVARCQVEIVLKRTLAASPAPEPGDWPQWRGAGRDGAVAAEDAGKWLEHPVELWRREVGGGYSGPVVADGAVFIHSSQGVEEVVASLRFDDGSPVWSRRYEVPFRQDPAAARHGRGPYSTPSVAGGRLFTFGVTAVLSAWDSATGKLLWRRESAAEFDPGFPYFGAASSPLVWSDLCFVHLGGHERGGGGKSWRGAFVALGVEDGGERWRWHDDGPSIGASPVVREIEGGPQLILKSLQHVVGLDPRTGEELWRIPFKVGTEDAGNTITTPLFVGGRLLLSDWDIGVGAWLVRSRDDSWALHQLWHTRDASLFMSSPVVAGGQIVGFSHFRKGELFGLDPRTGTLLWRGEPRSGEHASLLAWGDDLLALLEDGTLVVGKVTRDGLRASGRHRLGKQGSWAHPAVAAGRIVIRDGSQLVVFRIVEE